MNKEQFTVKSILNILSHCSPDALIEMVMDLGGNKFQAPITSMFIHETEDKRELISFLSEEEKDEDEEYDLQI